MKNQKMYLNEMRDILIEKELDDKYDEKTLKKI